MGVNEEALIKRLMEENAALRARFISLENICPFCKERESGLLCDVTIGLECTVQSGTDLRGDKWEKRQYVGMEGAIYTCDMMICDQCRTQGSPVFFNGGEYWHIKYEDGSSDGSESIVWPDYCPMHSSVEWINSGGGAITEEEAIQWRNHAKMALQLDSWKKIDPFPITKDR